MPFTSVTRLHLRSSRFLPGFAFHTWRSTRQVQHAEGFRSGAVLSDRKLTFWTMTLWRDEADMRRYTGAGAHRRAMPKLARWCDEASVVHWTTDAAPDRVGLDWVEAERRMRRAGRPSTVRHPGPGHADLAFDPLDIARAKRALRIAPAGRPATS